MRAYLLFLLILLLPPTVYAQSDSKPNSPSSDQEKAPPSAATPHSDENKAKAEKPQDKSQEKDVTPKEVAQKAPQQKNNAAAQDKDKIYDPGKDGVTRPIPVRTEVPEMPEQLRRAHLNDDRKGRSKRFTGTVVLAGYLDKDGHPHGLKVLRSLSKEADKAALDSVKQWKFRPCTKDGEPVLCYFAVQVSFNMY
jgi:protein TonB